MPIALVTGAGVRIGRAIATTLGQAGYDLLLHVHASAGEAASLQKELAERGRTVHVITADFAAADGVDTLAHAVAGLTDRLDALIHSAAVFERVPLAQLTRSAYTRMLDINVTAPLFLTQALLPLLRAAAPASVVHITDSALARPYAGHSHYLASKAALSMLTKTLALELAPAIRVNAVAPGAIAFPASYDQAKKERILARVPLGRGGAPSDVAAAVLFLLRDAPYVTGHVLDVDGGLAIG